MFWIANKLYHARMICKWKRKYNCADLHNPHSRIRDLLPCSLYPSPALFLPMSQIKNILFDLGGVLLDIDYNLTTQAFHQLGFPHFEEMYSQYNANLLFEKLETGHVSEETFYAAMQAIPKQQPSLEEIKNAWNAMLLHWRVDSLNFLRGLSPQYNLYLLSNTNIIHKRAFEKLLEEETGLKRLDNLFTKAFYSHLVGLRKPEKEVFEFVAENAGILPSETLFVEDSYNNLDVAKGLGFHGLLLKPGQRIETDLAYLTSSNSM